MKKIAKFEKVSYNQFKNDFMDSFPQYNEKEVEEIYHSIQLPKRATLCLGCLLDASTRTSS